MIHKLYGGEVELVFDEARHRYTANGVPCQGVTSALSVISKPALIPWALKMAGEYVEAFFDLPEEPKLPSDPEKDGWTRSVGEPEIRKMIAGMKRAHRVKTDEAADVGKIAHKFAEEWAAAHDFNGPHIAAPDYPVNPQARAACEAFVGWWGANHVQPHHVERVIYSRLSHYAGTVDLVATINDRLFVVDYKTSSGLYDEMRFQVSAYKSALVEEGVVSTDAGRMILRFAKDGSGFHVHELPAADDARDREAFLAALKLSSIINQAKAQKEAA